MIKFFEILIFENFGARAQISAPAELIFKPFFEKKQTLIIDFETPARAQTKIFKKPKNHDENFWNFKFWNFWRARAKNIIIWIFEKCDFFLGGSYLEIFNKNACKCARAPKFFWRAQKCLECARAKFWVRAHPCARPTAFGILVIFSKMAFFRLRRIYKRRVRVNKRAQKQFWPILRILRLN